MTEPEPIRVGLPVPDQDATTCAFSMTAEDPMCGAPSTIHLITMDGLGNPAIMYSCDEHADIARLLAADSHPVGPDCAHAIGWGFSEGDTPGRCMAVL